MTNLAPRSDLILHGYSAISAADRLGLQLQRYTNPARTKSKGVTLEEAQRAAVRDPTLIWVELPEPS